MRKFAESYPVRKCTRRQTTIGRRFKTPQEARSFEASQSSPIPALVDFVSNTLCRDAAELSHPFDIVECRELLICNVFDYKASARSFSSQVGRGDSPVGKRQASRNMKPQWRVAVDVLAMRQVRQETVRLKPRMSIMEISSKPLIVIVILIASDQIRVFFVVKRAVRDLLQFVREPLRT